MNRGSTTRGTAVFGRRVTPSLFTDDDARPSTGWANAIAHQFGDLSVGCVTGLVLPVEAETAAQQQFEILRPHRRVFHPQVLRLRPRHPPAESSEWAQICVLARVP